MHPSGQHLSSRSSIKLKTFSEETLGNKNSRYSTGTIKDSRNGYIIRVCSMNLNGKFSKEENYENFLTSDLKPDIIAVGFQELYFKLKDIVAPDSIFNSKIAIQPLRKWIDFFEGLKCIKDNYTLLLSKSFAGLCLFIFIRKDSPTNKPRSNNSVTNLLVGTVPVGTMGMANKGALSISFRFEEMSICFINCHLPAGAENPGKRQNSMQAVMQRLQLYSNNNIKSRRVNFLEAEYDVVFLFGDLNFRLQNITSLDVLNLIEVEAGAAIEKLLKLDELLMMKESDALYRCFNEANIEFYPTYKFIHDTTNYTKSRVPSYCDRILWMGSVCLNLTYKSHTDISFSDHIPISGDFLIDLGHCSEDVTKRVNKLYYAPSVRVESTVIYFGDVHFLHNASSETKIRNLGTVRADISIKSIKPNVKLPGWLAVIPSKFILEPKSIETIQFRIFIDSSHVSLFSRSIEKLNCKIICVSVANSIEIPIAFVGEYIMNIVGLPLTILKFIDKPITRYKPTDILKMEISSIKTMNLFLNEALLERILNLLLPKITVVKSFSAMLQEQSSVMSHVLQIIYDINELPVLATAPIKESPYNIATQIEAFLIFIKSLPQPIIPFVFQARLGSNPTDRISINKVLSHLPKPNVLVLKRMVRFFHELVWSVDDLNLVSHFIVTCIPPSSHTLKDPLILVMSSMIQRPDLFWR